MAIESIKTVTVFVSDQDRARDFYTEALGLEVRVDDSFGDARWLEVGPPSGPSLALHLPFPGTSAGAGQGVLLASGDLDADVARLRDAGVAVEGPTDLPWGRQATFADPDGNAFALQA